MYDHLFHRLCVLDDFAGCLELLLAWDGSPGAFHVNSHLVRTGKVEVDLSLVV